MNVTTRYTILIVVILGLSFLGMLYYVNINQPTTPHEEVFMNGELIGGEWVTYREYSAEYPGDVILDDTGVYVGPSIIITGIAYSGWFDEGLALVQITSPDDTVLWDGFAINQSNYLLDMETPFETETIDVGDYTGSATLVFTQRTQADHTPHVYTTEIVIE